MSKTKIEWTEHTWNPISGCTKISEGCKNCYAEKMAYRLQAMGTKGYENGFAVTLHPSRLREPLERKKPTMYFVCSMGDLFHEDVPFEFVDRIWAVMAAASQHTFQILTKRPDRMNEYLKQQKYSQNYIGIAMARIAGAEGKIRDFSQPLTNVWLGVTAENQEQADRRIPTLLDTPAALRFVSIEPMLSGIDLKKYLVGYKCFSCGYESLGSPAKCPSCGQSEFGDKYYSPAIDWVIVGGETGAGARPLQYEWVKNIQKQCEAARVPFFFKKWGKLAQSDKSFIDGYIDGVECRAMPEILK